MVDVDVDVDVDLDLDPLARTLTSEQIVVADPLTLIGVHGSNQYLVELANDLVDVNQPAALRSH